MLYLIVVGLTMFVAPLVAIGIEWGSGASLLWLTGKWFVFWSVGVRLALAGARQYAQPAFTSRDILGIEGSAAYPLVRELGGANFASGAVGLASLAFPSFVLPSALGAGLFYVVAAVEHLKSKHAGFNERVALVSDVFVAVVLIGFVAGALAHGLQ